MTSLSSSRRYVLPFMVGIGTDRPGPEYRCCSAGLVRRDSWSGPAYGGCDGRAWHGASQPDCKMADSGISYVSTYLVYQYTS